MARSEDHGRRDDKDDDPKPTRAEAREAKAAVTHEELEAFAEKLMERVRTEIALAASGVPLEERVERNA